MPDRPDPEAARARFAAATATHLTAPLPGGATLRHVDVADIMKASEELWELDARPPAAIHALYTAEERARAADLSAAPSPPLQHRMFIERGSRIVGCYWGLQEPYARYNLANIVLHPDARGQGLYTALLPRVIAAVRDSGFSEIFSTHRADNNAILVLNLKAGFSIAAFEITPRFGILVQLRKYLVSGVAEMFRYRIDGTGLSALRGRVLL